MICLSDQESMVTDLTKLTYTPKPLWTPEQLRQRIIPLVTDAHIAYWTPIKWLNDILNKNQNCKKTIFPAFYSYKIVNLVWSIIKNL